MLLHTIGYKELINCGRVPSFERNSCRYQVLCVLVLSLLSCVSSTTRGRKRRKRSKGTYMDRRQSTGNKLRYWYAQINGKIL